MGVDRPITEFFQPLKENKRGKKRQRAQDKSDDEAPDAKVPRNTRSASKSGVVLRSSVSGNKIGSSDRSSASGSGTNDVVLIGPPSSVSPPTQRLGTNRSKPLLGDGEMVFSTPVASKITSLGTISALQTPPLTGQAREKRTTTEIPAAGPTKHPSTRHALPTPITLPRRRNERANAPEPATSLQDPPSSPLSSISDATFPFDVPDNVVPSSQPVQDLGSSPPKRSLCPKPDSDVFKAPRTPVSRRCWDDAIPSSQSPSALEEDDSVGTSQSQERYPLLTWESRQSPVKVSPVKKPVWRSTESIAKPLSQLSGGEVASSVADEDPLYQQLLSASQQHPPSSPPKLNSSPQRLLSSPQRLNSSPPRSPPSRPLSQYTETVPGTYDDWGSYPAGPSRVSTGPPRAESLGPPRSPPSRPLSQYTETVPGTYDDWGNYPAGPSRSPELSRASLEPGPSRASTQLSETIPGTYDNWGDLPASPTKQTRDSHAGQTQDGPAQSTQMSPTQPGTYDNWTLSSPPSTQPDPAPLIRSDLAPSTSLGPVPSTPLSPAPSTQLSPTQPGTYDNWGKDGNDEDDVPGAADVTLRTEHITLHTRVETVTLRGRTQDKDGGSTEVAFNSLTRTTAPAVDMNQRKAAKPANSDVKSAGNAGQPVYDPSQAEVEDMLSSDPSESLSMYAGEGSFPDDFPESLKV
ncbi:hypothetical protein BD626DRAFT_481707 [Schizophyllum amplum]|uniref:Uncharacterized protein n=1 Tax=Schizophyllum amplum TaxID=97359 RepID=A0A550CUF9_9AGAR|nr:hypothetical protein BD626DRAFT_481707 [Auriculariopsis ampla]